MISDMENEAPEPIQEEAGEGAAKEDRQREEDQEEEEEGREMRIIKDPGEPTEREIEEHELTHVPFRAWCKACVAGKAQNDPHYHKQDAERESSKVPVISMDYAFMGQEGQEGLTKILVVKDRKMKNIFSHPVRAKGTAAESWIAGRICKDIRGLGYNRIGS